VHADLIFRNGQDFNESLIEGHEQGKSIMRKVLERAFVSLIVLASLIPDPVLAAKPQGSFSERRIRFARGAHTATLRGRVSRSKAILYKVGAKRGQSMIVRLEGDAKTRFDLSGPKDDSGQAMASGETEWSGTLPDDGDYKIFVLTEDRVNAPFTITVAIK
jgi:hypothetical protein